MRTPIGWVRATPAHRLEQRDPEAGAVLVIVMLFMTVALLMVALVLDLAQLRQDRASNRRTADMAATAAATAIATPGGTGVASCWDAWNYFLANTPNPGEITQPPDCASAFSGACDLDSARTATGLVGSYTFTITYPVPHGSTLLDAPDAIGRPTQDFYGTVDGTGCERVAIEIQQAQKANFGVMAGRSEHVTTSRSVARAVSQFDQGGIIALLLLEPTSCNVLTASGQAQVIIEKNGEKPGYITIDSDGKGGTGNNSCSSGNRYVVDAVGTQNSQIIAEASSESGASGIIRMFALAPGQGNTTAFEQADVTAGRLSPVPTPASRRIGRSPIDWRWNCSPVGVDGTGGTSDDCRFDRPAHIDALRTTMGTTGAPAGFSTYPRAGEPGDTCQTQPGNPAITLPAGNWWINCPSGFRVTNQVTFDGGTFVFQNGMQVGSSGSLTINSGTSQDTVIYLRNGDLQKDAQASLIMGRSFVYLHNGRINMGAGTGTLLWVAPRAGNFEDLALWSESTLLHALGGQASLLIEGVFFTPNADPFTYTGQSAQEQRVNAQFVTRRMDVGGQGTLRLQPTPDRVAVLPAWGAALIR